MTAVLPLPKRRRVFVTGTVGACPKPTPVPFREAARVIASLSGYKGTLTFEHTSVPDPSGEEHSRLPTTR